MSKAIHFICHREGLSLHGLSPWQGEAHGYKSRCWSLSDADADALIGGWVYFHENKSVKSRLGGIIAGYEPGTDDCEGKLVILFHLHEKGRGQAWRGRDYGMAFSGRMVDADLEHER